MCGRYEFTVGSNEEINTMMATLQKNYKDTVVKTGEIFPTNVVPILVGDGKSTMPIPIAWGFPKWNSKGVIINARSETAAEKTMFKRSLLERRCVVPTTGFYEWDSKKQKYRFNLPDNELLYLAGIWNEYDEEKRFVILTTAANDSMKDVHNRMPVVLGKDSINKWVNDNDTVIEILSNAYYNLVKIAV